MRQNKVLINFITDLMLLAAVVITMNPKASGIGWHEWLSVALAVAVIWHLLLHWDWIIKNGRKLFIDLPPYKRIFYVFNCILFVDFWVLTVSGLVISKVVLTKFGIELPAPSRGWREAHDISANLFMILVAIHIAFMWNWVKASFKRFVFPAKDKALSK